MGQGQKQGYWLGEVFRGVAAIQKGGNGYWTGLVALSQGGGRGEDG